MSDPFDEMKRNMFAPRPGVGVGSANEPPEETVKIASHLFDGSRAKQGRSTTIGDGTVTNADGSLAPIQDEIIHVEYDTNDARMLAVTIAPQLIAGTQSLVTGIIDTYLIPEAMAALTAGDPICAILEFGSGGYQSQAEVDVGQGIVLNVPANFLRVFVRLDLGIVTSLPGLKHKANVGGWATKGPISAARPPTRTRYLDPAVPIPPVGGIRTFIVPPFARDLRVERFPQSNPLRLEFVNSLAAGSQAYSVLVPGNVETDRIPISDDVFMVRVINDDAAANLTQCRLIFELAL